MGGELLKIYLTERVGVVCSVCSWSRMCCREILTLALHLRHCSYCNRFRHPRMQRQQLVQQQMGSRPLQACQRWAQCSSNFLYNSNFKQHRTQQVCMNDSWARPWIECIKCPLLFFKSYLHVRFFFTYWHCGDESNKNLGSETRLKTVLCVAAGAAGHQHRSEACTMYGRYGNMSDKTGYICIM